MLSSIISPPKWSNQKGLTGSTRWSWLTSVFLISLARGWSFTPRSTLCNARSMGGNTRAISSMTVFILTRMVLWSRRMGAQVDSSPNKRDKMVQTLPTLSDQEFRKVLSTTTKPCKLKKCHVSDLDSDNDSDYRSWSCRMDSTGEKHTCKKHKLSDAIKRYSYPSSSKAIPQNKIHKITSIILMSQWMKHQKRLGTRITSPSMIIQIIHWQKW